MDNIITDMEEVQLNGFSLPDIESIATIIAEMPPMEQHPPPPAWSTAEDEKLTEIIREYGPVRWNHIAKHMKQRTADECRLRWTTYLAPALGRKKRWSKEEKDMLVQCVSKYGHKWNLVSLYLPFRSREQCRQHYLYCLDQNVNRSKWNAKEDKLLLNKLKEYGRGNWTQIARAMATGRSGKYVSERVKFLDKIARY